MNEGLSVHPSILPFGSFLGIGSLFFSETQHCVRGPCVVVCDRARFFERKVCSKNGPMIMCFEFIGKYSHCFFLNLVQKESLYYLLYSCTNLILGKNLVPEIWAKMLSTNQIAVFFYWLLSRIKWWKSPIFCMLMQIHRNYKLIEKYWFGHGQKWVWSL